MRQLSCAITLNWLIAPRSKHAMPQWIRRTAPADILGTDFDRLAEDPLYEALDKLYPHRAAIEAALVARERSLLLRRLLARAISRWSERRIVACLTVGYTAP